MTREERFLRTMIEYVKWIEVDEEIRTILNNSKVIFIDGYKFTHVTNQRRENAELRVSIPLLQKALILKEKLKELCFKVYETTPEYDLYDIDIKPRLFLEEVEENINHEVSFDMHAETIINAIKSAKYSIWGVVAWFSNSNIYDELVKRKDEGLDVRVIMSNEGSNLSYYNRYEGYFDLKIIDVSSNSRNRVHDKFCVFDFEYVLHGSYNWSQNANYNHETLATGLDREFAKAFADEFLKLYILV